MNLESIIVAAIVGGCALYFIRRLYRMFTGKAGGSCGCSDCPVKADSPNPPQAG